MSIVISSFLIFFAAAESTETFKWSGWSIEVPGKWNNKMTAMPSLSGFYLKSRKDGTPVTLFAHGHSPNSLPTQQSANKYWADFNRDQKKKPAPCRLISAGTYRCLEVVSAKKGFQARMMLWKLKKTRVILKAEGFSSSKAASSYFAKLKVNVE